MPIMRMTLDSFRPTTLLELTSLYPSSRRQYTQKFNDWGLCKNFSTKVMKSALRKRAKAGGQEFSVKFRGTVIAKENMDRWQKRVPNFNPLTSPTACKSLSMKNYSPFLLTEYSHPIGNRRAISMCIAGPARKTDFDKSECAVTSHRRLGRKFNGR